MSRIVFINRFFWPDEPATSQLLTDLAEGLSLQGYPVDVICRRPSAAVPLAEMRNGVSIFRIPTSTWGRRNLMGRAIDFGTYLRGARRQLGRTLRPDDIVVTLTDPPMLGPALRGVIRKRGARWIHWIQDIFPEVAAVVSGRRLPAILTTWRNRAWMEADHCITPSHAMADFVRGQGVPTDRITVSANWSPARLGPVDASGWKASHGCDGKFVVMYSGNLGRVHDFASIVPVAKNFADDPSIVFVFVGDGARRLELERAVKAANLNHVRFFPAESRGNLAETLCAGDLHLVTLRAGCESLVFPSKLYGIAAVGRPALVLAPRGSEPTRVVTEHGFGVGFASSDITQIADHIRMMRDNPTRRNEMGAAALAFAQSEGTANRAVADWTRVLDPLIRLAGGRPGSSGSRTTP